MTGENLTPGIVMEFLKGSLVRKWGAYPFENIDKKANVFSKNLLYSPGDDPGFKAVAQNMPELTKFCNGIGSFQRSLGNGYTVRYMDTFDRPQIKVLERGPFLQLDHMGEPVGILGFRVGLPIEIHTVQGLSNTGPQEFYKKTGKHFDEALIDTLISVAGKNLTYRTGPPKAVLMPHAFYHMYGYNSKGERSRKRVDRLVKKYCPRSSFHALVNNESVLLPRDEKLNARLFRIREKHFAKIRRNLLNRTKVMKR